jgi:hypothetical protein
LEISSSIKEKAIAVVMSAKKSDIFWRLTITGGERAALSPFPWQAGEGLE